MKFWISGKFEVSKKKTVAADLKRRLIVDDKEISPFASIKLVEKKEKETKKEVKVERKKPSEIVQGYDPSSSFADILYSYEHTGEPYSMPSPTKGRKVTKTDFGEILDKWEGRASSSKKKSVATSSVKSTYKPTKSFQDILDSYEGRKPKKEAVVIKEEKKASEEPKATVEEKEDVPLSENLFRKPDESDAVSSSASWSIYGGRNENFVRPEPIKEEPVKETSVAKTRKSEKYRPTKSFQDILDNYEGKKAESYTTEKPKEDVSKTTEEPFSENLFKTPENGEKREPGVAWSVFGGNENFVRSEKAETSFGDILDRYNKEKRDDKTFEDYLKEKGDDEKKKEILTISKLRAMSPQSTLDLHGYTVKEAESEVRKFLNECHENGLRKISIITGKGLHSEDGVCVLKSAVQMVLDESGLVSEKASAPLSAGGSGALWIILKA